MKRFALLLTLVLVTPASAQTTPLPTPTPSPSPAPTVPPPPPEPIVQPGVTVAGVAVGGQTESQMRAALRVEVRPLVRRPIVVRQGKDSRTLPTGRVKQEFDVDRTAKAVLAAPAGTAVKPRLEFIRTPIRAFVDGFAKRVFVPAKDAGVRITLRRIFQTKARAGRRLAVKRVNVLIERALADPTRPRTLRVKLVRTKPAVGAKDLKRRYRTIITIDKSNFTLRLFKRLRYDRRYGVAIGQPAYPTPEGLFAIQSKQVNPTWTAPNSPWAGEAAGQSFSAGDPNNPLAARWMGVNGPIGIHGTYQEYSIGTAASHGCIRMRIADVKDLFRRVSIGTPVLIR